MFKIKPITVGITGDMGSGKSYVSNLFRKMRVSVYDTDSRAKDLMVIDKNLRSRIKNLLPGVYADNDMIIKEQMAHYLFTHPNARRNRNELNALLGPYIKDSIEDYKNDFVVDYLLVESAILFETDLYLSCDMIIYVDAPLELRMKRAFDRSGITSETYHDRMKDQMSDKLKMKASDFIINNDGDSDLVHEVKKIHYSIMNSIYQK